MSLSIAIYEWANGRSMNILVTGGAGFIGSNLVHHLLGHSEHQVPFPVHQVINFDKLTYAGSLENLKNVRDDPRHVFIKGDIADSHAVRRVFEDYEVDSVMHLAAESHVDRSIDRPDDFIRTNVMGTFTLLEEFRRYLTNTPAEDTKKRIFLHVSTDEVFGSLAATDSPFTEETPYAPNSPYSATKASSDHLARAWCQTYNLPVITTYCSNNYGPFQFPEKLLPRMIRRASQDESLPVYGDGSHVRDWLHVSDHCHALALALARGEPGGTYAIGGQAERTNLQVVSAIVRTVQELAPTLSIRSAEELIAFVADRPGHDQRYAVDSTRIRDELGWRPSHSFESGLRETVAWYLKNEEWVTAIERSRYRGERLGTLSMPESSSNSAL